MVPAEVVPAEEVPASTPLPAVPGESSAEDAARCDREKWRACLVKVYTKCNPSKLGDVDWLLDKYKGKEAMLHARIVSKYLAVLEEKTPTSDEMLASLRDHEARVCYRQNFPPL